MEMRTHRLAMAWILALLLPALAAAKEGTDAAPRGATAAPWIDLPGLAQGCDGVVRALAALPDGRIAVGGTFTQCGGTAAANIATWNPSTGSFAALGSGIGAGSVPVVPAVSALARSGDTLFVGGSFAVAGGVAASNVARFDLAGGAWTPLGNAGAEGVAGEVLAFAVVGSAVYVGGEFRRAGGIAARHLARFDSTTGAWSALPAAPNRRVRALAVAGTLLYAGGDFSGAGSVELRRVGRFDTAGGLWSALGSGAGEGVDDSVTTLATVGETLYVGGAFRTAGGAAARQFAAWNPTAGWTRFESAAGGLSGGPLFLNAVRALAAAEGQLFVLGDFTLAGGQVARHVARLDPRNGAWFPLGAGGAEGLDGPGYAIAIADRGVIVGGGFRRAGGAPRSGLAAVSAPEGLFTDGFEPVPAAR